MVFGVSVAASKNSVGSYHSGTLIIFLFCLSAADLPLNHLTASFYSSTLLGVNMPSVLELGLKLLEQGAVANFLEDFFLHTAVLCLYNTVKGLGKGMYEKINT